MDFMVLAVSEWKAFDTLFALDSFGRYWLENERLILQAAEINEAQHGPKWKPQTQDEYAEYSAGVDAARHLHDKIVLPTFRYSCLIMLFTIVERELLRLVRNLESERGTPNPGFKSKKGSLLKPVEDYCKTQFHLRLSNCREYCALCDLQKARDCIVHCHGEVSLSQDAEYLIRLKRRRPGFEAYKGTTIELESECIKQFLSEAWRFFLWVFHQRKWRVDDEWLERKWA